MLDYDDLILYTYSILRSNKEIECKWAEKFDYIMVDEAQDCSFIDWAIINHISSASGNLFVVGDPDQCIYQWRGAAPKYLVDFKPNTDIVLNENYRSTQSILDVANDIIACNKMRVPKNLYSTIGNSPIPTYFYLQDDIKEGKKMAHPINPGGRIFDSTENLYLCAMNNQGLLALAQLILPSEILTNFEVVRVEEEASLIRIYLDESVKAEYKENPEIESKGFCEAVTIRDFPIRDKGVDLIVRRRKWYDKQNNRYFSDSYELKAEGTRYSKEFAAFLKGVYGDDSYDLPFA